MRVFISYAHQPPENAAFVERVRARLEQSGIETWIDAAEIKSGDPWRRAIVDGLRTSDHTIAFLSKQSVRDPGVCLDELNIALHVKGGAILPVLIEPETEVQAPHHIGGSQWIDMAAWRDQDDAWFEARVAGILAVLTDPKNQRFAAEIDVLERALRPIEQAATIAEKIEGFVGREWMRAALDERRGGALPHRLIWITGGPGTGKSAFAAWLATWHRGNAIALNLCEAGIDARNDPAQVVRTIGFQLARRADDYRGHLLNRLARLHDANVALATPDDLIRAIAGNLGEIDARLRRMQPETLFDWLLAEPLHLCIDGGRRHDRYLVLLDGLDETLRDGECPLADLLMQRARLLPEWLAIAASSRDEPPIRGIFDVLEPLRLDADGHTADLRVYAQGWLGADQPALIERVVAASEGAFLYLTLLRQAVESGSMSLTSPEGLPRGLAGIYRRWFRHRFPDRGRYAAVYRPVISVIAAARQPVPLAVLARVFPWTAPERAEILQTLGTLFPIRGDAIAPFHASLRDWLRPGDDYKADPDYMADDAGGVTRLTGALWPAFTAWLDDPSGVALDSFTRTELPTLALRQTDSALREAMDLAGPWDRLAAVLPELVQSAEQTYAWAEARDWLGLALRAASLSGADGLGLRLWAWVELGDLEITLGRTEAAEAAFKAGLSAAVSLVAAGPNDLDRRRDLSVSHDRIGDVKIDQGDLPGALAAFAAGMDIARSLAEADPGNAGWRRDLFVSHTKIGGVKVAQGDLAGALAAFTAGMDIARSLAEADPGNAGWRRDLSVSHDRIGDVKVAQGDLPGALAAFTAGMDIARSLAEADPGNAGWRRDLSISHERIGNVKVAQGDLPGALAAFTAGMDIRKSLAEADPGNAGWRRDIVVSHTKLARVKSDLGDEAAAMTEMRAALAVLDGMVTDHMHLDPGAARLREQLLTLFNG